MDKLEAKEALADLVRHPGVPALIKEIDRMVADIERRVLTTQLDPTNSQLILFDKARAEGAKKLSFQLVTFLKTRTTDKT